MQKIERCEAITISGDEMRRWLIEHFQRNGCDGLAFAMQQGPARRLETNPPARIIQETDE